MGAIVERFSRYVADGVEGGAALLIAIGAVQALWSALVRRWHRQEIDAETRAVFIRFATWMLLGLEFTLAADIVRTAVSPTWTAIGELAAITVIRTALNHFLKADIRELTRAQGPTIAPTITATAPASSGEPEGAPGGE
jgi:uncharacterized membrane protein